MTTTACTHCAATTTNGLALCGRCQVTLTASLVNVAAYHTDVLRIQPGERVKIRSTFKSTPPSSLDPVAFDPISTAAGIVDLMVDGWVKILRDDRPTVSTTPLGTTRRCGWLEANLASINTLLWAGELLRDMLQAERDLRRILDKADTGWYAGLCGNELAPERSHDAFTCGCSCHHTGACDVPDGCGDAVTILAVTCERGLYASPGNDWIRCPECGATWQVQQRREYMIREARDELAPVAVIARAAVGLFDTEVSVKRLSNRIDQWVTRGQLHDLGVRVLEDRKPHRIYRIGDVFDLMGAVKPKGDEAC